MKGKNYEKKTYLYGTGSYCCSGYGSVLLKEQ